jgi:hypothetical protein
MVIPNYIEYTPIVATTTNDYTAVVAENIEEPLIITDYLSIIYFLGVLCFTIRFIIQLTSLSLIIFKNKKEKNGYYTYIKTKKNVSPFSFFNWIVFNPNNFTKKELEQIITHEKVHVDQHHSIDILLTQLTCITLWFNPFIWLYNKNLKQNLEFIADKNAQSKVTCKKSYQTTLLKTSMSSHQIVLSNHFYNSLIKKRIVMLHKSKSKKINLIKYAFIIPLLAIFLMSFNTKEVYIKKEALQVNPEENTVVKQESTKTYHILDTFKDEDLKDMKSVFTSKGYTFDITNLERNKSELITGISIRIKNKTANASFSASSLLPIKAIKIVLNKAENSISIGNISNSDMKIVTGFPSQEKADAYKESKKVKNLVPKEELNHALNILNGEEVNTTEIENLNADNITALNVLKSKEAIKKYGDKGKNGVIEITTKKAEWETKFIPGKSMSDINVLGDSIFFNKKFTVKASYSNISNNEPLYILDGKEIIKEEFQELNPNNIDSVNVLKGESAIEKYGDKGKNGVIEIITKKKQPYSKY